MRQVWWKFANNFYSYSEKKNIWLTSYGHDVGDDYDIWTYAVQLDT